jgi:NAD(P)-dependent dehydrogenase (short-subunit alcohol dehydrogenase family)
MKTVLVTGASAGIGKATVELFLQNGYKVYAAARRIEKMEELKILGAIPVQMDVTDNRSIENGIEKINQESGGVDILINNAGYGSLGSVEEISIEEAKRQFEVNIFGLARLTQLVTPHMRENQWGKIVNISSIGGKIYEPLAGWYHATKFALEGLSDCLRLELKGFGIDVIVVEPGPIRSEWGDIASVNLMKTSGNGPYKKIAEGMMNNFKNFYSEKRSSPPEEVARIILKSVLSCCPKTRYPAGKGAGIILLGRKLFSDKIFDKVMLMMVKAY